MYGKLFEQMYDGTLATKGPWEALVTFQQLIILADKDGNVDMTAEAISRRTTIPLTIIQEGLRGLILPDPQSRTPTEDGKRITPLSPDRDWGWHIVNYDHYRKIRSEEDRREYHRRYYHEKRKTQQKSQHLNQHSSDSTKAVSISSKHKQEEKKGVRKLATPLPQDFKISERVKSWAEAKGLVDLDPDLEFFVGRMRANGKTYIDWDEAFMNCVREDWAGLRKK